MFTGMWRISAVAMLAGILASCAQPAHVDAAIGSVMTPGNTQVPLPPGEWRQLAMEKDLGGTYGGGGTNNQHLVHASYALVENGRLKSMVNVDTSADALNAFGYIPHKFCTGSNLPEWLITTPSSFRNATGCRATTGVLGKRGRPRKRMLTTSLLGPRSSAWPSATER